MQRATIRNMQSCLPHACLHPPPPSLPYKVDTSRPSLRTNWTRLVPLQRDTPKLMLAYMRAETPLSTPPRATPSRLVRDREVPADDAAVRAARQHEAVRQHEVHHPVRAHPAARRTHKDPLFVRVLPRVHQRRRAAGRARHAHVPQLDVALGACAPAARPRVGSPGGGSRETWGRVDVRSKAMAR